MKKRVSKLLALALTATMLLSACGNNSGETAQTEKAEEGKESTEQTTEKTEEGKKDKAEASADEIKDLVIARLATVKSKASTSCTARPLVILKI